MACLGLCPCLIEVQLAGGKIMTVNDIKVASTALKVFFRDVGRRPHHVCLLATQSLYFLLCIRLIEARRLRHGDTELALGGSWIRFP